MREGYYDQVFDYASGLADLRSLRRCNWAISRTWGRRGKSGGYGDLDGILWDGEGVRYWGGGGGLKRLGMHARSEQNVDVAPEDV